MNARPALLSICLLVVAAGCSADDDRGSAADVTTTVPPAPSAAPASTTAVQSAPTTTSTATPATTAVPAPAKPRRLNAFQTPSGNIACAADDDAIRCDISEFTYAPPPKPASCELDWGGALEVEQDGSVSFLCAGDTVASPEHPKAPAGTSVAIGGAVCAVEDRSVRCLAEGTDGGLFLSPQRYQRF